MIWNSPRYLPRVTLILFNAMPFSGRPATRNGVNSERTHFLGRLLDVGPIGLQIIAPRADRPETRGPGGRDLIPFGLFLPDSALEVQVGARCAHRLVLITP